MIDSVFSGRRADLEAMRNSQPEQIISLYRNLCFHDGKQTPLPFASFSRMIDTIIEHEQGHFLETEQVAALAARR